MVKKILFLTLAIVSLVGCGSAQQVVMQRTILDAINSYYAISHTIKLGDSINNVLPKLNQVMKTLPQGIHRDSSQYIKNDVKIQIYYVRSSWTSDGVSTDDEYTPYIFNDGVLVAIGWETIGGPKTRAKGSP